MKVQNIEIPDALFTAAQEEHLVIFAGAGVSMQPPDPLPDFVQLTTMLSDELDPIHKQGVFDEDTEPCEVFLGRLDEGMGLRTKCAEILGTGKQSALHENIVSLLANGRIRLVTTNFDRRFEQAMETRGLSTRVFQAPALPLVL